MFPMDLFCFACRNVRNIELGVQYQTWAVATLLNLSSRAARARKAEKYLYPDALGILYCNPKHSFTTPFIVRSKADQTRIVEDIWPEAWCLPFAIEPLGDPSHMVSAEHARKRWPVVKKRWGPRGGVSAAMNITGTTVFVPVTITVEDWEIICGDLASGKQASSGHAL
jgi:hypothetical protein